MFEDRPGVRRSCRTTISSHYWGALSGLAPLSTLLISGLFPEFLTWGEAPTAETVKRSRGTGGPPTSPIDRAALLHYGAFLLNRR